MRQLLVQLEFFRDGVFVDNTIPLESSLRVLSLIHLIRLRNAKIESLVKRDDFDELKDAYNKSDKLLFPKRYADHIREQYYKYLPF